MASSVDDTVDAGNQRKRPRTTQVSSSSSCSSASHAAPLFESRQHTQVYGILTKEQQDWFIFWKYAHLMTEEMVNSTITTDAVKEAFNRAKLQSLPDRVKELYQKEDDEYTQYSIHTKKQVDKGKAEGLAEGEALGELKAKREMAINLLKLQVQDSIILEASGLTPEDLASIKTTLAT